MIKNYIDACMNEYRTEKLPKQTPETSSINENENNDLSSYQQPIVYHRYHSTNRYQQNIPLTIETSGRKLPSIPKTSTNKHIQNSDIDDNDDLLPMENGQFSSNINYVQRKPVQLAQVKLIIYNFK